MDDVLFNYPDGCASTHPTRRWPAPLSLASLTRGGRARSAPNCSSVGFVSIPPRRPSATAAPKLSAGPLLPLLSRSAPKYRGDSKNGRMEGQGEYFFPNGNVYVGQFLNNNFHGTGTIKFPGSGKYDATWTRGVASDGKYTFDDGLAYEETSWVYCTPEDRRYYTEKDGINAAGRDQLVNNKGTHVLPLGCYDVGDGYLNPEDALVYSWTEEGKATRPAEEKTDEFTSELEWAKENCRCGADSAVVPVMETEVAAKRIQAVQRGKLARKEAQENKKAATSLQSNFRGYKSRQNMKQRAKDAEDAEQAEAATKIAAMHRGKAYRKERREQEDAATKMQAIQRGRVSRRGAGRDSAPSPAIAADTEVAYDPKEADAATLIQSQMRGRTTRREMKAKAEGRAIEDGLGLTGSEEESAAIARMQAAQRGKMTRKELAQDKEDQEAASLKIQAIQRGKKDRAKVQGMKIEKELGLSGSPEEQASIAKMQAAQRGKQDRRKVAGMKQDAAGRKIEEELGLTGSPEEQASIAKMQAAQRGKIARKELAQDKIDQGNAASKIAAVQRGKQDRAKVQGMKAGKKIEEELGLTGSEEETAAIARMQAQQRGKMTRKEMAAQQAASKGKKIEDELGLTGSVEEQASIAKMQAAQRGKQDRRKVAEMKGKNIEAELGLTGSPEEQESIAKMQAAQRGKQDRAKVAQMKTDAAGKAIEEELGLTGSPEEQASIAKMQAAQRGKQDRAKVAQMKTDAAEGGAE